MKEQNMFFIFDFHSRNDCGMSTPNGSAVLTGHSSIHEVCLFFRHLCASIFAEKSDRLFEVTHVLLDVMPFIEYFESSCSEFSGFSDVCEEHLANNSPVSIPISSDSSDNLPLARLKQKQKNVLSDSDDTFSDISCHSSESEYKPSKQEQRLLDNSISESDLSLEDSGLQNKSKDVYNYDSVIVSDKKKLSGKKLKGSAHVRCKQLGRDGRGKQLLENKGKQSSKSEQFERSEYINRGEHLEKSEDTNVGEHIERNEEIDSCEQLERSGAIDRGELLERNEDKNRGECQERSKDKDRCRQFERCEEIEGGAYSKISDDKDRSRKVEGSKDGDRDVQVDSCEQSVQSEVLERDSSDEGRTRGERQSRKRSRNEEGWKQNVRKRKRNEGESYISVRGKFCHARTMRPGCGMNCRYKCQDNFSAEQRSDLFHSFWSLGDINCQRQFLLQFANADSKF